MATQPQNWEKVKALFHEALELNSTARSTFLRDKCQDAETRAEVERLLAEHDQSKAFLSRPALGDFLVEAEVPSAGSTASMDSGETGGVMIGRHRLLQKVGEGGMGEVWQAEQTEPIRRRVAIKLIKAGMNTREVVARFESERQALALMNHPAIAKVFDAGSTTQGAPYFVMEYVAGVPITIYCDNHRLSIRERLELFIHVCEGIQHAHQKAIIHRDLKPSNILVMEVDGRAAPKIIDFGVAKALTEKLTADTMFTRVGALVGTPEYMSPEQAKSSGEDIDTRTDVYSLGIIFYELLAGAPPIELRKIAYEEFLRRLREDEPPKPSTKIRTQDRIRSTEVARKRLTEPSALAKQMRGELDSIALKALEKDRSRRYGSPSDFAADIRRYVNNEAVLAVPPSGAYRVHKFARRHRTALVTACAFALVLIAAAVVSIRQSIRANREAIRANREAAVAEAVNNFLLGDLLARNSTTSAVTQDLKLRTVLDRAAERIDDGQFAKQPEVEAAIRNTIAVTYQKLGLFPEARKQAEHAADLCRRVLGPEHPCTLRSMNNLARIYANESNYSQAETVFSQALEIQSHVLSPEHLDTLTTFANFLEVQGKYAQAEPLYREAAEISLRMLGPEHPDRLKPMFALANVYQLQRKYAQAEAVDNQALEISRRVLGPEHPYTLGSMNALAFLYGLERKYAQAEAVDSQTLEIRRRVLGLDHPDTLESMNSLAYLYRGEGKYAQAEALFSQTLETRRRVLGPDRRGTLGSMETLASLYRDEGKYAQAEALFSQTLEIRRRVFGPEDPDTLWCMDTLTKLYRREGKYAQAEALFSQTLEIRRRVFGPEHPDTSMH